MIRLLWIAWALANGRALRFRRERRLAELPYWQRMAEAGEDVLARHPGISSSKRAAVEDWIATSRAEIAWLEGTGPRTPYRSAWSEADGWWWRR